MAKQLKGLVIVESPAKAKKINSYLGPQYKVMASMGHVRDLPANASEVPLDIKKEPWANLGINVDKDFEPVYVIPKEKKKLISELKDYLKDSDELILATDEDREGESIGWHLREVLNPKVPVRRMVFSEITKEAILKALSSTRQLDQNLVNAQEARRMIDRLYGFPLSRLLWKKVRPKISAGRVQSVAVRIIVQREIERRAFHKGTYWDLQAEIEAGGGKFLSQLVTVDGKKIATGKDFDEHTGQIAAGVDVRLLSEEDARLLQTNLASAPWKIAGIEERQETRRPSPPFTTSTLQQEASRKLGMSSRETMQVAQRLYEDGLITYMRTDSVTLSQEAITASRNTVTERYGDTFLSDSPRQFTGKSKNAQEAHEAIRPAGTEMKTAAEQNLGGREFKLYDLIWKRTVATQMAEARLKFQTVTLAALNAEFRATGRTVEFAGFFRAYVEGADDPEAAMEDQDSALPVLSEGQGVNCTRLDPLSHETQPPARYTEASLIKALEEEGIGRPSTYASIIGTIQDRQYVVKNGSQLRPTFLGMAVTRLLETHFPELVDQKFTAAMEQKLDDISTGDAQTTPYLRDFYSGDGGLDNQIKLHEVQIDPRLACTLELEGLDARVRVGKFGPYLEQTIDGETFTAGLPEDIAPADLTNEMAQKLIELKRQGPKSVGDLDGLPISVMNGPFGPYLQQGTMGEDGTKPKRVSLPKNVDPESVSLDLATQLFALPRKLGKHPETDKEVTAGIGRFGPYVLHAGVYKSLGKDDDVLTITLEPAIELLKQARVRAAATPLRELGPHPVDQEPVGVFSGRYGPYVKHGDINATIPKETPVDEITMDQAVELLAARAARGPAKKKGRGGKTATAVKKTAKKKAVAKADAPKKATKAKKAKKAAPKKKEL